MVRFDQRDASPPGLMGRQRKAASLRSTGPAAVAKGFHHQRIEAKFCHGVAGPRVVLGAARQPVAAEAIGQGREQRALSEAPREQTTRTKPTN